MDLLPKKYTVIQRTFDGKSSFDKIKFFIDADLHLHGVQVCVRDISAINGDNNVVIKSPLYHG